MSKAIETLAIATFIAAFAQVAFAQSPPPDSGGYGPYYRGAPPRERPNLWTTSRWSKPLTGVRLSRAERLGRGKPGGSPLPIGVLVHSSVILVANV
jgi:hypothetical protein